MDLRTKLQMPVLAILRTSARIALTTLLALALAWGVSNRTSLAADPATATSEVVSLASSAGPEAARAPERWLGLSGKLRALVGTWESLQADPSSTILAGVPAQVPGVHPLGVQAPDGDPFYAVALLPFGAKSGDQLHSYRIGSWPEARPGYAPPAGFIEVTAENQGIAISDQFRLADFLTHDQADVWPKFLVVKPVLLDKLELISSELARRGLPSRLHVMSGFRTPQYNVKGVGKGGRASLSRHMYGDAADVFVDEDRNGNMDDLNRDGRITRDDALVLFAAAERVERKHPDLVGGLSAYKANSAHGPFVHVDVRGRRARW
jgi:Peptidase M15